MDDTLLNGEGQISAYTLSVLTRTMDKGIRIILASGRAGASMRPYVEQVRSPFPYIACNGGEIIDPKDHRLLDSLQFSPEKARSCARFAEGNGFYVQAYDGDVFYYAGDEEYGRAYAYASNLKGVRVARLSDYIHMSTPKLLCVGEPEGILALMEKGRAHFGGTVCLSISKPIFLEMTPPGATKGGALNRLSALLPVKPETTMAFGDSLNDLSMLTWAEYGVAMENGRQEIKEALSFVCPPNTQDGVARYIARHILKEDVSA